MSLKKNTLANYLGRGWEALIGFALIPIYIRYLGVEAWGLVGFMSMLQAWLTLLDMGLTPTLNREMARFRAGTHSAQSIRDLLRSLEVIYGGVAAAIVLLIWLGAPWVAEHWLKDPRLMPDTVSQAIAIMGLVLAGRMLEQVYRGAIQGLQHMVWLSAAQAALATLRWAGVVGVLVWVEASIRAFFLWQGLVSLISVIVLARQTYRYLPAGGRTARFDLEALRAIRQFAGGMAIITLLGLLLTQVDKLLLSKLVSLREFGYYALATTVASGLFAVTAPMSHAVLPRLTELVARADQASLIGVYHRASQWMGAILIPPALVMAVFPESILWAWTNDKALTQHTAPLLSLLALGTMLNGFMHVPYRAQLAHGWTGLAVRINIVAVACVIPVILWTVPRFGAIAAAWTWVALNAGHVLIDIHFMHRKILMDEKWRWYGRALAAPIGAATAIVFLLKPLQPENAGRVDTALFVILAALLTAAGTLIAIPDGRNFFRKQFGI